MYNSWNIKIIYKSKWCTWISIH